MTLQTFAPARFAVVVMSIVVATIVSPVTDAAQQSGVNQPIFRAVPLEQRSQCTAAMFTSASPTSSCVGYSTRSDFESVLAPDERLFLPVVTYPTGGDTALTLAVADLNGDGISDLAVLNECGEIISGQCNLSTVGIMLGNGDGTFQGANSYALGQYGVQDIAVGDVNGDGRPDLILINSCGSDPNCGGESPNLLVLLGNGDGTFRSPVISPSGTSREWSLAVADLNRDGKLDVIITNCNPKCFSTGSGNGTVSVLLGRGDGSFAPPVLYSSGGLIALSVAVGDVNADGIPDILVANCGVANDELSECGTTTVLGTLIGKGDGTFREVMTQSWKGNILYLALADVNNDGKIDALVSQQSSCEYGCQNGGVAVLLGNGDGTFRFIAVYDSGPKWGANSVAVSDLDGDGNADLLVANQSGALGVLLGKGNGTFAAVSLYDGGGDTAYRVVATDLNGDNKPDAIVTGDCARSLPGCKGVVGVLLNNSAGCMAPPEVTLSATPMSLWPPNGKILPVTLSGTIRDTEPACTMKTATYAVRDEYGEVQPSGPLTLDAGGAYSFTVWLPATRLGTDLDGRFYTIALTASNNAGKTESKVATVVVPHDQGR